jgi:hypothetical protein
MSDIRPLSFGEILDGSLTLYRRHFGLLLRLAVAALTVPVLLVLYFVMFALPTFAPGMLAGEFNWDAVVIIALIIVTYIIGTLLMTASTIRVVSDAYLQRVTTFTQALGLGLSRIWSLFVA